MPATAGGAGDEQVVSVAGRRVRLTNLGKVLYPATGTTKGEVIDYYSRIAPVLIPHVAGRPVTRKRWVEGVGTAEHPGAVFFAKDLEAGAPSWVPRLPIPHSGGPKDYPLVEDVATLVYLAQVASLELHVPQWRFAVDGARGPADRLVLDLDPGPEAGLAECAQVARWARDILTGMGLAPHPVTSGSKGIHLYAALPPGQSSEAASALAHELARALEADHPDLVVSTMRKAERTGRVLVDWSQNNGSKTTIAPYSLRGRPEPTVAAPRTWEELDDPGLRHLLLDEVLARVASTGDPMAALGFHSGGRGSDSGPLSAYIAKRSADRTPEPVPGNALAAAPASAGERARFVIQEHHASRLHWDLRLEHDGVLVSWAVPKGVPATSERNSLAVQTEDHPLEYGSFEGSIPRGEYGAGSVTIWDHGRYDLEKWRDDEIIFTVDGRAGGPLGRTRLALIRTHGEGEKSTWLLHRMKPDAARPATVAPIAPMLATTATPGLATAAADRWRSAWAEIKWDGVRAIGVWDGSALRLFARTGGEITDRYPEVVDAAAGLGSEPAILDGEIVALDAEGRPSFTLLQNRMHLVQRAEIARERHRTPVRWHLFDALSGPEDPAPLRERRLLLERVADEAEPPIVVAPVFDDVALALAAAREHDLEGIVVKDPASRYRPGIRSESWLKVKLTRTQDVVIGGIRPGHGSRSGSVGSLLVGVTGPNGLEYAGRVGSGFSEAALARLAGLLAPLGTDSCPFADVPAADAADAIWVEPLLVGEVEFAEWTPGGSLRHARWRGLRNDRDPAAVVRED